VNLFMEGQVESDIVVLLRLELLRRLAPNDWTWPFVKMLTHQEVGLQDTRSINWSFIERRRDVR